MTRKETGASLLEYSLCIALIAVAAFPALTGLGSDVESELVTAGESFEVELNSPGPPPDPDPDPDPDPSCVTVNRRRICFT